MQIRTLIAAATVIVAGGTAAAEDKLNDPQIATIALTAHQLDAERGKLAQKKTKNEQVKQFADQMVTDHTTGANEVLALAKKLGVKPEESAVTKSLKDGATETNAKLGKLKGAAFDKAYVDAEVAYHQAVIDAVNKVLLPAVKNPEVKKALEDTGPTLQGHLVHAQQLQTMLAKK
jgi:putative membrane protein